MKMSSRLGLQPTALALSLPICLASMLMISRSFADENSPRIQLVRTPNDGIQPQAVADSRGVIHLVYLKGDPARSDLFYVRSEPGQTSWSRPIRVNSRPGSAIAIGTIRGAQIALGRNGRVHVAWNGSFEFPGSTHAGAPMLYSRLKDDGSAFEPERDLITKAAGLDGGGSVAADARGNVYVTWHAHIPGREEPNEANRAVFVAKSRDDGQTFAPEVQALAKNTGACGCCGMRSLADHAGNVYLLYRAASEKVNRDEVLLVSRNGSEFQMVNADPWNIPSCPMSSAFLTATARGTFAAWETEGRVCFAGVDPEKLSVSKPISPMSVEGTRQRHPALAANRKGETLITWTEGTGWQKGGALAWQVFDAQQRPTRVKGRRDGVPVWSLVAAVAEPDGTFVLIY